MKIGGSTDSSTYTDYLICITENGNPKNVIYLLNWNSLHTFTKTVLYIVEKIDTYTHNEKGQKTWDRQRGFKARKVLICITKNCDMTNFGFFNNQTLFPLSHQTYTLQERYIRSLHLLVLAHEDRRAVHQIKRIKLPHLHKGKWRPEFGILVIPNAIWPKVNIELVQSLRKIIINKCTWRQKGGAAASQPQTTSFAYMEM